MGHSLFNEKFKMSKFRWNILLWHGQTQEDKFGCFHTMSILDKVCCQEILKIQKIRWNILLLNDKI